MYIFGFRGGWLWIFPTHPAILVDLLTFALVLGIGYVSAGLAFRIQYFVMAVIAISLVLILGNFEVRRSAVRLERTWTLWVSDLDPICGLSPRWSR